MNVVEPRFWGRYYIVLQRGKNVADPRYFFFINKEIHKQNKRAHRRALRCFFAVLMVLQTEGNGRIEVVGVVRILAHGLARDVAKFSDRDAVDVL